jgi:hypothetical protein
MDAFNKFILDNGLLELPRFGSKYTWTNKQINHVMSVLDRVLVCNLFNCHHREASCDSLTRVGSDHNPLIVDTKDSRLKQQYNFRFEPLWLDQQGFKDMLKSKWPDRMGSLVQDFWKEIKCATRKFCRGWIANFHSQLKKDKKYLLDKIEMIDMDSDLRELDVTQWQTRYSLEADLEQIYSLEELQLKRQSGIKWTLKGDANNSFFHGAASGRRRRGSIFYLEENGEEIREPGQLRILKDNFYKELFYAEAMGGIGLGDGFWTEGCKISEEEAVELIKPFTVKEIEDALKKMSASSAPGPDGFPVGFYRAFCPEIKEIVMEMFADFHRGFLNLSRLNFGMISLIPKLKEANNIRQFRPICVLNIYYKWFTKVLTTRLTPFANKIINKNQTTFIPGRFILEGVIVLHEILHELRVTKTKGVVLKLDFEKAYDKVHWDFLIDVLRQKNFHDKWIEWIKNCVEGGKVGVKINGVHGNFFNTHKGLRQGDPLSSPLFNLVSDALATMLDNARESGQIHGLVHHLVEGGITHLQYADDTIILLAFEEQSILYTKFLLNCFEDMSGLKVNYQKSEVMVVGGTEEEQNSIASMFNCNIGSLPMKYLGVMISDRHMSAADLAYVYRKVEKKLPTWLSVGLTLGGKYILIQSCLSSIPNYTMGVYLLQEEIHQKMDSARANIFWHGPHLKKKYHMASWDLLSSPKRAGGLGFTNTMSDE